MVTTNFDFLGRITLSDEIIKQFCLTPDQNLMITVDKNHARIVLCPTEESKNHVATGREIQAHQAAVKRKPTNEWQYIRGIDTENRVVLPKTMRDLLKWTDDTALTVTADKQNIYIY